MSKEEFPCDMCNQPMKCVKTVRPKKKAYRIRTFKCTVCDYQKDIYGGGGYYDSPISPINQKSITRLTGGIK